VSLRERLAEALHQPIHDPYLCDCEVFPEAVDLAIADAALSVLTSPESRQELERVTLRALCGHTGPSDCGCPEAAGRVVGAVFEWMEGK
jgi:hypothetical protein